MIRQDCYDNTFLPVNCMRVGVWIITGDTLAQMTGEEEKKEEKEARVARFWKPDVAHPNAENSPTISVL